MNLCSKEVPDNMIHPRIVNPIDGNLDARVSTSYVRYIITKYNPINYKNNTRKRSQGGDINKRLKNVDGN